jgi:tRNA(fMet)-specific endonuclease VapC
VTGDALLVLDTDVCIYLLNGRAPTLGARLRQLRLGQLATSTITVAELRFGALNSARARANLERVETFLGPLVRLPFDEPAAAAFAQIKHLLRREGTPIGSLDTMIAAVTRAAGGTLVTNNRREFARVPGLLLADWPTEG